MAECEEVLIENSLSMLGLRTLHIMRMGGPVNLDHWLELAPCVCRELVQAYRSEEKELGVHHLTLFWPTREITRFRYPDGSQADGVMWHIGKSWYDPAKLASLREAADWAAMTYQMAFGCKPTRCLVGKIAEGWKMEFEVEGDGAGPIQLQLVEEAWVPKSFIVLI